MILIHSPGLDRAGRAVPLVIIPCGARKADHPAAAGELYTGPYHLSCRRAADALTAPGRILILSAKHGLLRLDEVIAPYELRMGAAGSVLPARLREQARQLGVDQEPDVVILGGRDYVAAARSVWPDALAPLAGTGGMLRQRSVLAQVAASGALPCLGSAA